MTPFRTWAYRSFGIFIIGTLFLTGCSKGGSSGGGSTPAPPAPTIPTVTTTAVTAITQSTATGGGNITSDGNAALLGKGVCWSTTQNPTIADARTGDGTGTGSYTSAISGLTPNTTYYVRAYATNSVGTGYGTSQSFTTALPVTAPTVSTTTASATNDSSATATINITSTGNAPTVIYGVCFGTSTNPTIANGATVISKTGTTTGSFTIPITGLWAGTQYYLNSFVTNSVGTAYGTQVIFTTPSVYTIGQNFAGGLIAYIDYTGRHGFVVSSSDLNGPNGLPWDPTQVGSNGSFNPPTIGAQRSDIGGGASNTALIVAKFGSGSYAASVCKDYRGGTYSDWFLPSVNELNQVFRNKSLLGIPNTANYWWSSTEYQYDSQKAYSQLFSTGTSSIDPKFSNRIVRATRYF